jgi:DNA-binding FadR family transcriptional regulator
MTHATPLPRRATEIQSQRFRTANLRIPKTAELIAEHIRQMIIRGELKDGDFLESQGQLIDSYAVSRPTIREAFRILEAEELISVSRGSRTGARVHHPNPDVVARQAGLVLQARGTTLADVYQARLAMEPCAARLLAKRHTTADISRLRECFRRAHDGASDPVRLTAAIADFHEAVVELSGNHTLHLLISIVREIIRRHEARVAATIKANRSLIERKQQAVPRLKSLEKFIALVQASDERGAERHWRLHLENASQLWLKGQRGNAPIDLLD